jgi:hypothetical protein
MRILTSCLLFLALAATLPETSVEFRVRYGRPDVERFPVRTGLTLTVEYGPGGEVCRMRIEPYHGLQHFPPFDLAAQMDEVNVVLNEIVPPETRGKEFGPGANVSGSCAGAVPPTEYENVTVIQNYGFCQKPLAVRAVDVLFKRPACESLPKYSEK